MPKNIRKCMLPWCQKRKDQVFGISHHTLPRNPLIRKKWVQVIKSAWPDFVEPRPDNNNHVICSTHFRREDISPDSAMKRECGFRCPARLNTGAIPSLNLNEAEIRLEDDIWDTCNAWESPFRERSGQITDRKKVGDFTSISAANVLSNLELQVDMMVKECNGILQNSPNCEDTIPENIQLALEQIYIIEQVKDKQYNKKRSKNSLRVDRSTPDSNQSVYSEIFGSNIINIPVENESADEQAFKYIFSLKCDNNSVQTNGSVTHYETLESLNDSVNENEEVFEHTANPLRIDSSTTDTNQTIHNYSEKSYPASQNYFPKEEHNYFIFEDGLPKQCLVTTGKQKIISNQREKGRGRGRRKTRKKGAVVTKCKDESEVSTSPHNNCDESENVIEEQSIYFTNDIGDTGNEVLVSNLEHISSEEQDTSTAIWQIGDDGDWLQDEKSDNYLCADENGDNGQFEDCNSECSDDGRSVEVKIEEDFNSDVSDTSDHFPDECSSEDDGYKRNKSDDSWHPTSESEDDFSSYEDEDEDVILKEEERKKRYPTNRSRPKNKSRYQCEHCGEIIVKTKSTIQNHLFKMHGIKSGLGKTFKCDICGKQFKKEKSLELHVARHSDERPFECCECGRKYATNQDLNNHKKQNHSIMISHVCSVCGRSFSRKDKFKRHSLIHTGHKPYLCNQCGMLFNQVFNLVVHIKSHDRGTLPVKNCRQCGREFPGSPEKLAAHIIKAHMTIYPFRCQKCGHVFKDENTLGCHMRRHRVTDVEYEM